jgi:hypothetical protein
MISKDETSINSADVSFLLKVVVEYLKKAEHLGFNEYLTDYYTPEVQNNFWNTFNQTTVDLGKTSSILQKQNFFIIIQFFKECLDFDFLNFIEDNYSENAKDTFWKIFDNLKQTIFDYYSLKRAHQENVDK